MTKGEERNDPVFEHLLRLVAIQFNRMYHGTEAPKESINLEDVPHLRESLAKFTDWNAGEKTIKRHFFEKSNAKITQKNDYSQYIGYDNFAQFKAEDHSKRRIKRVLALDKENFTKFRPPENPHEGLIELNADFFQWQESRKENSINIEAFYLGNEEAQWWGIAKGLAWTNNQFYESLKKGLVGVLSIPGIETKNVPPIIGILHGRGGLGKTTYARQVAFELINDVHICKKYRFWWLDLSTIDFFMAHGKLEIYDVISSWVSSPDAQYHLVFIDGFSNWDKGIKRRFASIFSHLDRHERFRKVKFLLVTRTYEPEFIPNYLIYTKNDFDFEALSSRELNLGLLGHLESQFSGVGTPATYRQEWEEAILTIEKEITDINNVAPFHLCYIIGRIAIADPDDLAPLMLMLSRSKEKFTDTIFYDLKKVLERTDLRGFGLAILSFAGFNQDFRMAEISQHSFLSIAESFQTELYAEIGFISAFLNIEVNAWIVLKFFLSDRKKGNEQRIMFKRDDFAASLRQIDARTVKHYSLLPLQQFLPVIQNGSFSSSSILLLVALRSEKLKGIAQAIQTVTRFVYRLLEQRNTNEAYICGIIDPSNPLQLSTKEKETILDTFFSFYDINRRGKYEYPILENRLVEFILHDYDSLEKKVERFNHYDSLGVSSAVFRHELLKILPKGERESRVREYLSINDLPLDQLEILLPLAADNDKMHFAAHFYEKCIDHARLLALCLSHMDRNDAAPIAYALTVKGVYDPVLEYTCIAIQWQHTGFFYKTSANGYVHLQFQSRRFNPLLVMMFSDLLPENQTSTVIEGILLNPERYDHDVFFAFVKYYADRDIPLAEEIYSQLVITSLDLL